MKFESVRAVPAWLLDTVESDWRYLRVVGAKDRVSWYVGGLHGYELVSDGDADELELLFVMNCKPGVTT